MHWDRPVRPERTGWRDLALNERHKDWGWDCPANDLDFIEYDQGRAVALIEYKHAAAVVEQNSTQMSVLMDLGNRAGLPVFLVEYTGDFRQWTVWPLNALAKQVLPKPQCMCEQEWVRLLYLVRKRPLPLGMFDAAGMVIPRASRMAARVPRS